MSANKILNSFFALNPVVIPFVKRAPTIDPLFLRKTVPNLYTNIINALPSFLSGFNDLDREFLKITLSPYLSSRIEKQFKDLGVINNSPNEDKNQKSQINMPFPKLNLDLVTADFSTIPISISPYVIFGKNISQRIQHHPLKNMIQITRNRYFSLKSDNTTIFTYAKQLKDQRVYGFRCLVFPHPPSQQTISITFEGDINREDFYVVDIQNVLFTESITDENTLTN